ncbi:MAG: hypothetical protein RR440_00385 [Erysipelotrichaceae bacterium]
MQEVFLDDNYMAYSIDEASGGRIYIESDPCYIDMFDNQFDDEVFNKYCLSFLDTDFDYCNILEFVCDFDLEKMEFYGNLFNTFLHNMKNLTQERKQVLFDMHFDDEEELQSDMEHSSTTNMLFEQILKDILKIEDEDKQDDTIYHIFGETIYDASDVRKLQKDLFEY